MDEKEAKEETTSRDVQPQGTRGKKNGKTPSTSTTTPVRQKKPWAWIVMTIVILAAAAGYGGSQLYQQLSDRLGGDISVIGHQSLSNDGNARVTQEEEDIESVVDKVSPSVVSITTTVQTRSYFGVQEQEGAGTGIIVSQDGLILTNKHVVSGSDTVRVILSDGTIYPDVRTLGSDPLNDIAFLKIPDVSNLPAAELGDSSSIRVGQKVVAIGNSLGQYDNTVTSGIISGTGRPISASDGNSVENLSDLIQTDAAINPGNSGGPLLNLSGQVIGVNTAIIEDAQGIGFSIPINATKGMLKGVVAGKGVERAYLGVNYIPITPDVAREYDLSVKAGAYVYNGDRSAVVPDGPADKAGMKTKDIITKVGGIDVGDKGGVATLVGEYAPGDTIEIEVLRSGQVQTLRVTLEAYKKTS